MVHSVNAFFRSTKILRKFCLSFRLSYMKFIKQEIASTVFIPTLNSNCFCNDEYGMMNDEIVINGEIDEWWNCLNCRMINDRKMQLIMRLQASSASSAASWAASWAASSTAWWATSSASSSAASSAAGSQMSRCHNLLMVSQCKSRFSAGKAACPSHAHGTARQNRIDDANQCHIAHCYSEHCNTAYCYMAMVVLLNCPLLLDPLVQCPLLHGPLLQCPLVQCVLVQCSLVHCTLLHDPLGPRFAENVAVHDF